MKVYIIEVGAYSDRYVSAVFAKREDAERYICLRAGFDTWEEVQADERRRGNWNEHGDIEEFELWESVPHAMAEQQTSASDD